MAYDFSRFSTQSFERFIQALAADVVGARVRVYGAGPDGAREATYEGRCQIGDEVWNGYLVFQAKYHQAADDLARNATWLMAQIDTEMDKFADPRRGLRRPDYYVLASNVRLSANAADARGKGEGGIDKVTAHLSMKASELGIKEAMLWHQDTLASLLDIRQEVRTTFGFWVQPGDLLAALLRQFDGPDHAEVLGLHLRERLRQSRDIKTKDIGQTIGRAVALDEVFIDLPIDKPLTPFAREGSVEDVDDNDLDLLELDELELEDPSDVGIVAALMRRSADRFGPDDSVEQDVVASCRRGLLPNRVVLLGGPGQGKSTVGQLLAQLCRARLLSTIPQSYSAETNAAIKAILGRASEEQIPVGGPLRYPFHVELPSYADALSAATSEKSGLSILAFLAKQIGRDADIEVRSSQLVRWLGRVPSIMILDGLDEVPASGNRSDVILAIEQLLDTIQSADADALVFATSRPQGYQDELSRAHWGHWHLKPLESVDALRLVGNLAPVLVSDDVRREEIISKLAEASQDATTAPLLTSPLQVMQLFQLVATHNNIPKDRWTLFNRHYETLRDREISKGGITGNTIGTFKQQIDGIHADAGYLLHLRAEGAGAADAYFTTEEFRDLVRHRLEVDEFEEDEIATLTEQIVSLATNRLVFMRSQVDGRIAFDIRSLQEFMAAARLTTSPEAMIIRRLQEIAGRSHWLHVLRIAASKILGSTQHEAIRDDLIAMLDSVDAGDRLDDDRILRTGSRIAMQLLVDGTAANIPAFRRKLIVRTLNLLDLPDPKMSRALFSALDFGQKALLEPRLIESLNSENSTVRKAALRVLALASASAKAQSWTWAKELLLGYWPAQNEEALDSWDSTDLLPNDPETLARLHKMQFASPPSAVVKWRRFMVDEFEEMSFPSGVAVMSLPTRGGTIPFLSTTGDKSNIGFNYWKLSSASNVIEVSGDALPIWHVVRAAGLFSQDPSLQSALAFLDEVISLGLARDAEALSLPWLLHALVEDSDGENALLLKRSDLLSGIFGDTSDWLAREAHWELGIDVNAIAVRWIAPPGSPGRLLGLPTLVGLTIRRSKGPNIQKDFLTLLETFPNNTWAVQTFLSYLARLRPTLLPQTILYICQSDLGFLESIPNCLYYLAISLIEAAHTSGNAQLVSKLQAVVRLYPAIAQSISLPLVRLVDLFERFPEARELISIMVAPACRALQRRSETKLALPPAALGHLPGDSHVVTASITALRVLSGTETDRDRDTVERLLSWDGIPLALILDALTRGRLPVSSHAFASIIARAAITRGRKQWTASAYSVLEDLSEAAPVELLEQSKAKALRLPLALPSRSASSE